MKKASIYLFSFLFLFIISNSVIAQTPKKHKVISSNALKTTDATVDALMKPANNKAEKSESATRGDVYGPNFSDIIIDNYTNFTIDIYVDGNYRGTIAAWDKRTTWAVPGNTKLYAKATFDDGTYYYWGPDVVLTGYEYTWQLHY